MLVDPFLSPILTVASVLNNGETGDIHITYFKKTVWAGGCKSDFDDCLQQKNPHVGMLRINKQASCFWGSFKGFVAIYYSRLPGRC